MLYDHSFHFKDCSFDQLIQHVLVFPLPTSSHSDIYILVSYFSHTWHGDLMEHGYILEVLINVKCSKLLLKSLHYKTMTNQSGKTDMAIVISMSQTTNE